MDGSDAPCFQAVFTSKVVSVTLVDNVNYFQTFYVLNMSFIITYKKTSWHF